ncbi:MAG: Uma2 family endonuclease [Chloroflexia bacterium]|nr:Uma2 family endonuclease [Chloroflexia bacterium]
MAVRPPGTRLTAKQFFRECPSDDKRYELIDGQLHEMTTPSIKHQRICGHLFLFVHSVVSTTAGEVFPSRAGIVLGDGTVLVPDLVVLTQRSQQLIPSTVSPSCPTSSSRYFRPARQGTIGVRRVIGTPHSGSASSGW